MAEPSTCSPCACPLCGHFIEYRVAQAGQIIECPRCGEPRRLPEPIHLGMLERFGPPIPEIKKCCACNKDLPFSGEPCPECTAAGQRSQRRKRLAAAFSCAGLATMALIWVSVAVLRHPKKAAARTGTQAGGTGGISLPHSGTMIIEHPRSPSKYGGGLVAQHFYVEQKRGSEVVMAVGEIENNSDQVHRGLRVDVDLFNRHGVRVGTVSDYITELPPHQSWHFLSTVDNTNACVARLAQISENN